MPPSSAILRFPSICNPVFVSNYYDTCKFPRVDAVNFLPPTSTKISAAKHPNLPCLTAEKHGLKEINSIDNCRTLSVEEKEEGDHQWRGSFEKNLFVAAIRALPGRRMSTLLANFEKDGNFGCISDFNDLLNALVAGNKLNLDLPLQLYSRLSSYGLEPDSSTFSAMIECHCKRNDVEEAERVLNQMLDSGCAPPEVTVFTTLIHCFCQRGKLQKAFRALEMMERVGRKPSVQTYNCLLKGLCYVGRVEEAFELLQDIKKMSTVLPDMYTYTVMMDGFCRVGRSDEAMELMNEALGMELQPTAVSFNALFHGYNKEGRPLKGIKLLQQMEQRGLSPDYVCYSTLLRGLLLWRQIPAAARIYEQMVGCGYEADEGLMNNLLRGLCNRRTLADDGLFQVAHQVFEKMKKRGFTIDCRAYNVVIEVLCRLNKVDDALVSLREMINLGSTPRVITLNILIRTLCERGEANKAVGILVLMLENHIQLPRLSYDSLIDELNRQCMYFGASSVYSSALVRGVVPQNEPHT
ncbi:unnamed protein product [Linum tenue]|uniref:Pentatricopeptide repeat-containing protein n=2 Tax=Linum tenue TaxID=586396 RepID=A0AAV0KS19_9ROSI|nr:unnamed protein product [Linum tenue]